jgi:hypothetical protein
MGVLGMALLADRDLLLQLVSQKMHRGVMSK